MRQSPVMKYLAGDVDKMRSDRIQIESLPKEQDNQASIEVIKAMRLANSKM